MSNPAFVDEWLKGKTAEDFEVLEHLEGRLLWPVKLQRLKSGGPRKKPEWTEEPAYLQILDCFDLLEATAEAMRVFEERSMKPDDPRVQALWAEVEMHAHVSRALREAKPNAQGVYARKHTLDDLLAHKASGIARPEIFRLYESLEHFSRFEDPRLEKVDKDTAIRVALAINEVKNVTPLGVISGPALDTCVIYWAEILSAYLLGESSAPSPESSTPAPSPQPNSTPSSTARPT